MKSFSFEHLENHTLDREFDTRVDHLWSTTAMTLACLAEFDARKRYLPAGYPSMRRYCVDRKGFTEDMAAKGIHAARTARRFPAIFPALADSRLSLTAVLILAPHLTPENADELLAAAANKSCAEIQRLIAARCSKPEAPAQPQPLTTPIASEQHAAQHVVDNEPEHAAQHVELVVQEVKVTRRVEIPESLFEQIHYAQSLSHAVAPGDVVGVLQRAVNSLIEKLEQKKFGARCRTRARRGSTNPRYIPPAVRKAVWLRDGGQCTFVGDNGHRCEAPDRLEFDHIITVARGGQPTIDNTRLLCRAHNQYAAAQTFGEQFMQHKREQAKAKAKYQPHPDLIAALRTLEYRGNQLREASMLAEPKRDRPVEEQLRFVLQRLAPKCRRDPAPLASVPAPA